MTFKAFISGCASTALTPAETELFGRERPCGLILFARNVQSPGQVQALVADFKAAVGSDEVLILIDQEGGRVQRLRPPHWRAMPPARVFGDLYASDPEAAKRAAFAGARLIAAELTDLGINVNCTPCIDVPQEGAHDIIGDRAFSTDPEVVSALGRAVMDGTLAGGVLPVIKHVPGHGRALADSHKSLPRIDASKEELEQVDFKPFRALHDAPLAMTAHVLLPVCDECHPATLSPAIMGKVIRDQMGLTGLIMSDDIGMEALEGSYADRTRAVIAGGCDVVLHCSGKFAEMTDVAGAAPLLEGKPAERFEAARAALHDPEPFDEAEALALVTEAAGTRVASLGPDPTVQA
ncbi:MAG: beta-N-acetylhexosaminidase [Alphaproteobacteria bacterium]|uniref:beta-N-acetylhexosaminidase n=1 Tax=Methyloceanibacter sp. TaxID=1965321 RepID=UPI0035679521